MLRFGIDCAMDNLAPEAQEAKTKNSKGYCELIERIDTATKGGSTAFTLVTKTATNLCPKGNCQVALANLDEKCLPQTQLDCGTLLKNFGTVVLARGANPDDCIAALEEKSTELQGLSCIDADDQFMHKITNGLGKDYVEMQSALARKVGAQVEPMTIA